MQLAKATIHCGLVSAIKIIWSSQSGVVSDLQINSEETKRVVALSCSLQQLSSNSRSTTTRISGLVQKVPPVVVNSAVGFLTWVTCLEKANCSTVKIV